MDRRHWLGLVGSGVGVSLGEAVHGADRHGGDDKATGRQWRPVDALALAFCGIHIAKNNPKFQLVAQHYCMSRHRGDTSACFMIRTRKNARLLGVEYIRPDLP